MHPFLLRLLLLAVFFNTAIGVPLHAAAGKHLQMVTASAVQAADTEAPAPEHAEHGHGACTWCQAQAQQAHALASANAPALPVAPRAATRPVEPRPRWAPAPERWPFAARAPPHTA
jgi:hypothetical protein